MLSEGISGHFAPLTTLSHTVLTLGIWETLLLYCDGRCDGGVFEGLRAMLKGPEGKDQKPGSPEEREALPGREELWGVLNS